MPTVIISSLPVKSELMTGEWRACEYHNKSVCSIRDISSDTFDYGIGPSHEGFFHKANALVIKHLTAVVLVIRGDDVE